MIKLRRANKPAELTSTEQKTLTAEFKSSGVAIWRKEYITNTLLAYSHNKCAYCECDITEESKYLEVEHFHHKDDYPDEVVEWDNLLPSCKKCNGTKGTHDTYKEPIINPCDVNPQDHLILKNYRIKGKNDFGKLTVSVLDLNNQDRHCKKRFEIGNAAYEKLEDFLHLIEEYESGASTSTRRKNRILNGVKDLLRLAQSDKTYSATTSSIILYSAEYREIKSKLNRLKFWDEELVELEKGCLKVTL
ncbi:MAG: HNH endonuclease [Candidatus Paceibacterota bacterium]